MRPKYRIRPFPSASGQRRLGGIAPGVYLGHRDDDSKRFIAEPEVFAAAAGTQPMFSGAVLQPVLQLMFSARSGGG
jgi:hypothetical protein